MPGSRFSTHHGYSPIVVTARRGSSVKKGKADGDSGARDRLLQALADGRDANRALRQTLQWGERQLNRLLRQVEQGAPLTGALDRVDIGEVRDRVGTSLDLFERARHAVKVSTFLLAEEEGLSIGQLSRRWKISRQRGQQLAHEAG